MVVRRSRLDMIFEVLEAVNCGAENPSSIKYEANLSWDTMNDILLSLTLQDYVDEFDDSRSRGRGYRAYRITGSGENILQHYRKAEQLLKVN
jgi:predicted transcriptional regulator